MSIFTKNRWKIINPAQHPLKHEISDLAFTNDRLPNVTTLEDTLNTLIAAIYPNYIATVATPAALPASASANDYYIVSDDGDGNAAGYVWQTIDGAGQWVKRFDMDWSADGLLQEAVNRTLYMYAHKYGFTDKDEAGVALAGALAGQHLYGGDQANQHLTLHANSGDTGGARTGFIQVDDSTRPTVDNALDLGTSGARFANGHIVTLSVGTVSSTGNISAGGNLSATGTVTGSNLSGTNTGDVTLAAVGATPNANGASLAGQVLTLQPASDSFAGVVSTTTQTFGGAKTFEGALTANGAATGLTVTNDASVGGALTVTGAITGSNLSGTNTGDVTLGAFGATANASGASLAGQVLTLQPASGTHPGAVSTGSQTFAGDKTFSGALTASSAGTGLEVTNDAEIGGNLTLTGNLITGAQTFVTSELMALRNVVFRDAARTQAAEAGDTLFYDAVSGTWLAAHPDTEITHDEITGLTDGDAGHTQFVMLQGRSGGQTVHGGTAASENLHLESTSHATKGDIILRSGMKPLLAPSYSGTWDGLDFGSAIYCFRHFFSKGEFKGFRFENYEVAGLPSASASAVGRAVWATDVNKLYVDVGGSWVVAGVGKYMSDTSWSAETTKDVTVSSSITDARTAIWSLKDNANDYEQMLVSIKAISATQVRITTEIALTGTYRLIGLE